jgi:hypothetical protein
MRGGGWPGGAAAVPGAPDAGPAPCVVDASLSLCPNGLFWVLRLAEAMPVWLPQSHWAIVDDEAFYARDRRLVARLAGGGDAREAVAAFARTLGEWREAREALRLEARRGLYWAADGWAESVVPKDGDAGLIERRDALAAGLDGRSRGGGATACAGGADALADCARDALALAAALGGGARPLLLAAMAPDDAEPELVSRLELAGVPCPRLGEAGALREALRDALVPALLRCGLAAPIAGGRMRLAGLLAVAPRALHVPAPVGMAEEDALAVSAGDPLGWDAAASGEEAALWDDASAVWWEVP